MDLFNVRFTYDGQNVRGASGITSETMHTFHVKLPVDRWLQPTDGPDVCDLLDLVVEQLACFSDNLLANNRKLRRRREQLNLF